MEKLYSTGEFAKMAGVTLRTIRYYDKIGLLKPTKILDNGYRRYCNRDLITLQKILSLKELGFSLEEIYPLIQDNNQDNFKESIKLQTNLIDQKIKHLTNLKDSLKATERLINKKNIAWDKIIELIRLSTIDDNLVTQYMNAKNLDTRIKLHDKFSINQQGWFPWIFEQIDFSTVYRLLELGCGNGKLWENNTYNLRNREIFLSDNSEGMIDEIRQKLGNDYNYIVADCQSIPSAYSQILTTPTTKRTKWKIHILRDKERYHQSTFSNPMQTVGIKINVNKAEKRSPPITVIAKGAPMAPAYFVSPMANGNIAAIVVIEVIKIGRIRDIPAVINARFRRYPLLRKILA